MSLTGNIGELLALSERIGKLDEAIAKSSEVIADKLAPMIADQFTNAVDPYGVSFAPLAPSTVARGRGMPPGLTDTGDMKNSVKVFADASINGVRITVDSPAGAHQVGWHGVSDGPARSIVPSGELLPVEWETVIEDAVTASVNELLGAA